MFTAEEKHIALTVKDFNTFCNYINQYRPKLTQRVEVLGKKNLFELNAQLFFMKNVSAPNYVQSSYPVIDLLFRLAILSSLYRIVGDDKTNIYLESTSYKIEFDGLNNFEKYCFLLETFWTKFDFMEIMRWGIDSLDQFTKTISESKPGQKLVKGTISKRPDYDPFFSYLSEIVHYFNFFGFCSFESIISENKKLTKYDDSISKIITTDFGVNICKILKKLRLNLWNYPYLSIREIYIKDKYYSFTKTPFMDHLKPIFPNNALLKSVKFETTKKQKGNYTFKVILEKEIWRKIKLSHKLTLEELHLYIQKAFDFDNDHLYSFFMDGKKYSKNAYHSSYRDEIPYANEAIIGELGLYKGQKILYLFDYGDSWEFIVQLVDINENEKVLKEPQITEIKGESPPQYEFEEDFDDDFDDE